MTFSVLSAIIMVHLKSNLPLCLFSKPLIQFLLLSCWHMTQFCRCSLCLSHSIMILSYNTPYYQQSLTTFHHSLQQLNDPTQLAHYYTSIDDDSSIWTCLNAHIGYYSMTNAILRLYLSQPLIPLVVIICTCPGHPNIDTVGRHP